MIGSKSGQKVASPGLVSYGNFYSMSIEQTPEARARRQKNDQCVREIHIKIVSWRTVELECSCGFIFMFIRGRFA